MLKNYYHLVVALAAIVRFGYPAKSLTVIAVTGTDGKTTTSTLIYYILKTGGEKVALISTVAAYIGTEQIDTGFHVTTPDPWKLQRLIKKALDGGCKYIVLEVTSIGIDQWRIFGTNIDTAVLTNVTHEHLDYHGTFNNYLKTKAKIFKNVKNAVLNKSDSSYKYIKSQVGKNTNVISYDNKTPDVNIDILNSIRKRFKETYNQLNALAATEAALIYIKDKKKIAEAIKSFEGVPGRMEEVPNKKGIRIIVDYAHTPNALRQVLEFLVSEKGQRGRIISVFGCTGERDFEKRPIMGKISTELADISIFTADDPRGEDVNNVISQIVIGAEKTGAMELTIENLGKVAKRHKYIRIPDRKKAINIAINRIAKAGDIILVAGMGHQTHIAINGKEIPWNDKEVIKGILS